MSFFKHILQDVKEDSNNSSTTNLDAGNSYTFTGTGTSTLGVVGLQWNLRTDQNAIVYIEQSDDNTNWDISDSFNYYYIKGGDGGTVQAITSYWRIRVVLTGSVATTYFRLKGILCPIADPLPRSLDSYERLVTSAALEDAETNKRVDVSPFGELKTVSQVRLIGTAFSGTTKDPNFWTESTTGSGAVTQAGEVILSTGVTADSTVYYDSVRKARKPTGTSNQFRTVARLITDPQADNLRRIGAYDDDDGFFFQINGTTFGLGARKGGVDTIVTSGNFNGNLGSSVVMDTTIQRLVITYTSLSASFFVNDVLLHTIAGSTVSLTNTLVLPIRMENVNSNGNITDNSFEVRFATILRLGSLITNPTSKYISTNSTTILKYGAGTLQRIVNCDNSGNITIYNNTAASGTILAAIDTAKVLGSIELNITFDIGLTIVTALGAQIVAVYE